MATNKKTTDPAEQNAMGDRYFDGLDGFEQDIGKAVEWFKKSAEQGYAEGQHNLAYCCKLAEAYEEAEYWYLQAAKQGFAKSQLHLADLYLAGEHLDQDLEMALHLYTDAAEQDNAAAQFSLALAV